MKTQRNAPCPCGSQIKYKKCCGTDNSLEPEYPTQLFGIIPQQTDPVCMVSNVTSLNQSDLQHIYQTDFPLGTWFLSIGAHEDVSLFGPYNQPEEAFEKARTFFDQIRFSTTTQIIWD